MSSVMSIDYGSKRIGLAIADKNLKFVRPLAIIANDRNMIFNLKSYCNDYQVTQLVVGLPRNMEGEETAQSQQVREFVNRLTQAIELPVDFQDETLTTVEALKASHVKKTNQERLDSFAAAVILRDYLEQPHV
jgi:putative Holliday junction resolvase